MVNGAPTNIKENVDNATADDIDAKLKDAGDDVEII
jgi:ribosomal protein L7/L12